MSTHTETVINLWENSTRVSRSVELTLSGLHGIGFSEYMVLFQLTKAPNYSLRRIDLAIALNRTASGITRMLIPMEKVGLIQKEINPRDARVSLVKITESGLQLFKNASVSLDEKSEQLLKRLTDKDIQHLSRIFEAL